MKTETNNEYHQAINRVVDYINTNLNNTLDLKTLSGVANISEYHFHRIFSGIIGESLASHISRLRLEYTAQKLQTTNFSLTEIAERAGYQSQYSLSKAFKKHFGVTPSAFRNIHTYFSNQIPETKSEVKQLNPKFRFIEKIELVYIRIIAKYGSEVDYESAWRKLWKFAKQKELINESTEYLGLSYDDPNITRSEQCRFYACISTEQAAKVEGEFGTISVEGGKYAVFLLKGSYSGLNDLYKSIYLDWLLQSGIKLRNSMPFEKYLNNPDKVSEEDILTEVWIPVKD